MKISIESNLVWEKHDAEEWVQWKKSKLYLNSKMIEKKQLSASSTSFQTLNWVWLKEKTALILL